MPSRKGDAPIPGSAAVTKRVKKNVAASVRQRLLNIASKTETPFNEILQYFTMERLLYHWSGIIS